MLARARLRDDPLLLHALREQALAQHVVDLVRAGVTEILALQIDPGAARSFRESLREVERRGAARVVRHQAAEARLKLPVPPRRGIGALELDERAHERLGDVAAAVAAEVAAGVGQRAHDAARAAAMKRRTFSGSLQPGRVSTPELTSTP